MDTYSKGQVQNLDEFQERLGDTLIAMGKEGAIGAATGAAGKLVRVGLGKPLEKMAQAIPGRLGGSTAGITETAAVGAEVVAMVGAGSAMHGEVPEAKDFALAAVTIGFLRAGHMGVTATRQGAGRVMQQRADARENTRLAAKFRRIYVRTGLNPKQVVEAARQDPTIIQDLSSVNIVIPRALQSQVEGVDPQLVRAAEIVTVAGKANASTLTKEMPDLSRADADALLVELEQTGVIGPRPPLFAGDRRVNATSEEQARQMVKPALELERTGDAPPAEGLLAERQQLIDAEVASLRGKLERLDAGDLTVIPEPHPAVGGSRSTETQYRSTVEREINALEHRSNPVREDGSIVVRPDPDGTGDGSGVFGGFLRSEGRAVADDGPSLPGHAYRGMEKAEYDATVGAGRGIQSRGDYSMPGEGTSLAKDFATAENYVNFGRSHPARTGEPTYLVEVEGGGELLPGMGGTDYLRLPPGQEVAASKTRRVWEMQHEEGVGVVAREVAPTPPRVPSLPHFPRLQSELLLKVQRVLWKWT